MDAIKPLAEQTDSPAAVARSPVRSAFIITYVVAATLLFALPRPVLERLSDFEPGPTIDAATAVVRSIAAVSDRTGLPDLFESARKRFLESIRD